MVGDVWPSTRGTGEQTRPNETETVVAVTTSEVVKPGSSCIASHMCMKLQYMCTSMRCGMAGQGYIIYQKQGSCEGERDMVGAYVECCRMHIALCSLFHGSKSRVCVAPHIAPSTAKD